LRAALIVATMSLFFVTGLQGEDSNDSLDASLTRADARHLLLRTGIGVAPADLLAYTDLSRSDAIEKIVSGVRNKPAVPMPSWTENPLPHYIKNGDLDDDGKQRFRRARDAEFAQLRQWWVLNMLQTDSPQTERLVLFWHDLFATSYYDLDRQSLAMARQNQTFREHGFGSWSVLLKAMIQDPALMRYLNANSNKKKAPNENLGRELLELFTLGEGNYEEATVREAARALTGRTISQSSNLEFLINTWQQDRGEKLLFGQRGKFDGDDLIDLILEQDASARFLATRFWHAFISDGPVDDGWLQNASTLFADSDHDISVLYQFTLESSEFWHDRHRGAIIKSPIDVVTGLARTLEFPKSQWRNFANWQAELGLDLFAPRNVSGWKEGVAFITPGKLLSRFTTVDAMLRAGSVNLANSGKTMSDSTMMSTDSMMASSTDMMSRADTDKGLQLRIAAEDYQGAARYQVALGQQENILWESDDRELIGGHDTELFGRLDSVEGAAWQLIHIPVPAAHLSAADKIFIRFTNDHAGPGGDRNLYIDGVQLGGQWLPASYGEQKSKCVPDNPANSGYLYCGGELMIERTEEEVAANGNLPDYRAASAHVLWANQNRFNNKVAATFALTDVATPAGNFHTIHFNIGVQDGQPLELRIDSFDCWPDCFESWPDCAWQDDHFKKNLTLRFPLVEKPASIDENHADWCHYRGITSKEQTLVGAIWKTLPDLLVTLGNSRRTKPRFIEALDALSGRLISDEPSLDQTIYASAPSFVIDAAYAVPAKPLESLPDPLPLVPGVDSLEQALASAGMSLDQLLMPGFNDPAVQTWVNDSAIPFPERLSRLLDHPSFQLR